MKCYILNPKCSGHIDEWQKLIPHVKNMGLDTVHLLPINAMGDSQSPYAINNHFEIDSGYDKKLSAQDAQQHFEHFVSELKKNKIKLCIDLVLNHVSIDHVLLMQYPGWAQRDVSESDGFKRAGWQGETWNKWEDLALLDYDNNIDGLLWKYMRQYVVTWAGYAEATNGCIRLDNLHSCYQPFLDYVLTELRLQYPNIKIYAELFADYDTLKKYSEKFQVDYLLGTPWEHKTAQDVKGFFSHVHNNDFTAKHFVPVNTHDSGSLTHEFGSPKALPARMALSALLGTGSWGFYQGAELGLDEKIPFVGKANLNYFPAQLEKNKNSFYMLLVRQLNEFISSYASFFTKGNLHFFNTNDDAVICAVRSNEAVENENTDYIYIFINFDFENAKRIKVSSDDLMDSVGLALKPAYKNLLTKKECKVKNKYWEIDLPAGDFSVFGEKAGK